MNDLLSSKFDSSGMTSLQTNGLKRAMQNYSTKVSLCLALGLIGQDEAKALSALGKIRNEFAHRWNASFDDAEIQRSCKKLPIDFLDDLKRTYGEDAYDRFGYTASSILRDLISRVSTVADGHTPSIPSSKIEVRRDMVMMWVPS